MHKQFLEIDHIEVLTFWADAALHLQSIAHLLFE